MLAACVRVGDSLVAPQFGASNPGSRCIVGITGNYRDSANNRPSGPGSRRYRRSS